MKPCIRVFHQAISNSAHTSTYKLAWARAIIDLCEQNPATETIGLDEIAERVFASYWNQTIFFDLAQISSASSRAEIVQIVQIAIEKYREHTGNRQPDGFERARSIVDVDTSRLVRVLKKDVSYRFTADLGGGPAPYQYTKGEDAIVRVMAPDIAQYAGLLHSAVNLKWAQVLEDLNPSVPRIANKVAAVAKESGIARVKKGRGSLSKFRRYLDIVNHRRVCFYCDRPIDEAAVSVDHVLPWSYLFHNDLWNLVYAHRACNSAKNNRIPDASTIQRLKQRNTGLLQLLRSSDEHRESKEAAILEHAISEDLVGRFWIGVR